MRRTRRKKITEADLLERYHCVKASATSDGGEPGLADYVLKVAKALNKPLAGGKALPLLSE